MKEISDELAKGKKLGDEVEKGILVGTRGTGRTADGSAFIKALGELAQTSECLAKILQGGKGVARDPKKFVNVLLILSSAFPLLLLKSP
ncbi:MAG: hypothetical protein P0Y62_07155 [Candidatus Chryseobacterium colombiense]|nr:hypothetical protein [Chryseobacterium sp.]WEK71331.1 MAG: hypothetical protein P0Y62_07155 [Chryseobacterium sp.]